MSTRSGGRASRTTEAFHATATARAQLRRRRKGLADEIRDLIVQDFIWSGLVPAGALLPSETELSDSYGVSRVTLRAALRSLQGAGLISVRHGVGSVVLPRSSMIVQGLDRLCSIETFAREVGRVVATEELEWLEVGADEEMAERLEVVGGSTVLAVRRIKVYGGVRVAWLLDFIPEGAFSFDVLKGRFRGSVLDVLLAYGELAVEYADCEITPVSLDREIAERLHVHVGTAALLMDEVTRAADGRAVAWAKAWLLPDHLRFVVRRRRQFGH